MTLCRTGTGISRTGDNVFQRVSSISFHIARSLVSSATLVKDNAAKRLLAKKLDGKIDRSDGLPTCEMLNIMLVKFC